MAEKTILSVPPEDGHALRMFVDQSLTCNGRGEPTVLQRQRRRSNMVLLLGLDVPAAKYVVRPSGEVLQPEVICERMEQLTRPPANALTAEEEQVIRTAKTIINFMSRLRSSPQHLLELLKQPLNAAENLAQVAAALSLGLSLGGLSRVIIGTLAGRQPMLNLNNLVTEALHQAPKVQRPDNAATALEAALRDLRFSNGLTPQDLTDRKLLRERLRAIDVEVFQHQETSPHDLLKQVMRTELPMDPWKRLAGIMDSTLKQHPSSFDVLSTQEFRRRVLLSPDHVLYTASMVFDSEGRLRTNADAARAFFVVWHIVATDYGNALATGAAPGRAPGAVQPPGVAQQPVTPPLDKRRAAKARIGRTLGAVLARKHAKYAEGFGWDKKTREWVVDTGKQAHALKLRNAALLQARKSLGQAGTTRYDLFTRYLGGEVPGRQIASLMPVLERNPALGRQPISTWYSKSSPLDPPVAEVEQELAAVKERADAAKGRLAREALSAVRPMISQEPKLQRSFTNYFDGQADLQSLPPALQQIVRNEFTKRGLEPLDLIRKSEPTGGLPEAVFGAFRGVGGRVGGFLQSTLTPKRTPRQSPGRGRSPVRSASRSPSPKFHSVDALSRSASPEGREMPVRGVGAGHKRSPVRSASRSPSSAFHSVDALSRSASPEGREMPVRGVGAGHKRSPSR
jgi:hypothetical protein